MIYEELIRLDALLVQARTAACTRTEEDLCAIVATLLAAIRCGSLLLEEEEEN